MISPSAYFEIASPAVNLILGAETISLTRSGSLYTNRNEAPNLLLVKTTAATGATSIVLEAEDGQLLTGSVLADTAIQISGHAAAYRVAADAAAAGDGASITLTLTSALTSGAVAGTEVTIAANPTYTWTNALVISTDRADRGGDPGTELWMIVDLPVAGAPTVPAEGDSLTRAYDGSTGRVTKVPSALAGSWRIQVGAA